MFGKAFVRDLISRSAENESDRRRFLQAASLTGMGVVGAGLVAGAPAASAAEETKAVSDGAVLNFALNLEYLEAEFYLYATTGRGLAENLTTGTGRHGTVTGGHEVPWRPGSLIGKVAMEIAGDELAHVKFLRSALGGAAVSEPDINLRDSFTAAARAAGLIGAGQTFDPFASEANFLLGAFLFEDVGVTAYKGASPLIENKAYLEAAAGILSVEAYHAGIIRSYLSQRGLGSSAMKISMARDSLDGGTNLDQGIYSPGAGAKVNLVPTDANGITYSRGADQVLNIVYLNPAQVTSGGFFPAGVNGEINTSGANS